MVVSLNGLLTANAPRLVVRENKNEPGNATVPLLDMVEKTVLNQNQKSENASSENAQVHPSSSLGSISRPLLNFKWRHSFAKKLTFGSISFDQLCGDIFNRIRRRCRASLLVNYLSIEMLQNSFYKIEPLMKKRKTLLTVQRRQFSL